MHHAVSATSGRTRGTLPVYEKAGSSVQVLIYEGRYYAWVELSATRVVNPEPARPR